MGTKYRNTRAKIQSIIQKGSTYGCMALILLPLNYSSAS